MTEATFTPMDAPGASGTPLTIALGADYAPGPGGAECMRIPFREDLVDEQGGLANGVVIALLDPARGFAVAMAPRRRAEMEGRELRIGAVATVDLPGAYV